MRSGLGWSWRAVDDLVQRLARVTALSDVPAHRHQNSNGLTAPLNHGVLLVNGRGIDELPQVLPGFLHASSHDLGLSHMRSLQKCVRYT